MFQNIQNDGDLACTKDVLHVTLAGSAYRLQDSINKSVPVMRIVVTAGGTGGHINPALSVAQEFRKLRQFVLFVGGDGGSEEKLAEADGLEFLGLRVKGFDRSSLMNRITAAALLPSAVLAALKSFSVFRPDAVIGFGGYASGPAAIAAVIKGIPLFLLEQNVYPGLVTRILGKRARRVYSSFSESSRWLKGADVIYTGNPTRPGFYNPGRSRGSKEKMTLLVMGGSQGAHSINRAMIDGLLLVRDMGLKVYHQTGVKDFDEVKAAYSRFLPDAVVAPFFDDMDKVMAGADIAVARAGASTCSELMLSGLPVLLIPYPGAGGHQQLNAQVLVANGAARQLEDSELTGERLAESLGDLLAGKETLERMSANSRELARPDAVKVIVRDITKLLEAQ